MMISFYTARARLGPSWIHFLNDACYIYSHSYTDTRGARTARVVNWMFAEMHADIFQGDDTAGPKWYGMPKQELDDNTKRELHVLRLRNVLDPKRHYRSTGGLTKAANPKYFQIGQVVPSIFDRESSGRGSDGLFGSILRDQSRRSEFRQRYEKLQSSRKPHARTAGLKKRHKK